MKVTIKHTFFAPKCAYINFQNDKAPDVFYNTAVAFRKRFIFGDKPGEYLSEDISEVDFRDALQPGKEVYVRWSKKSSAYVVRL